MTEITIRKPGETEIEERKIRTWPIWTKEVSRFDWYYESREECLILEGDIIVETLSGSYNIQKGDFVIFEKGVLCTWNVIKPVRKHYQFS
jgi:uncharacterized protein